MPRRQYQTAAKPRQEENSPENGSKRGNPKEGEEESAKAEEKEGGWPVDEESVTGDTPGGPDVKAQKRKTSQEKKRNETKETKGMTKKRTGNQYRRKKEHLKTEKDEGTKRI